MTHQLVTLFWIISNILTFHFYTFSVIYTFYFFIAFEELTFYKKCSMKCVLYSLFYKTIFNFLGVKQSPLMLTSECVDSRSGQRLRWKNADLSHFCTKVNRTKIVLRSNPKHHFQPQYVCCNSKYMFFLRFHLKIIVKHFVKNIFLSHLICLAHQVLL